MLIDAHMHVGKLYYTDKKALTPGYLLRFMDRHGIAKAWLMPMENPEHTSYYVLTEYVLKVSRRHPDRFIPFCNVDPRRRNVAELIAQYKDEGCAGYGETISDLPVDDPLLQVVYETCGELGMPITFDMNATANRDEAGLPRFEKMIRKFKDTVFIGHAQHFWAEIAANPDPRTFSAYPTGKIRRPGAVVKLLRKYRNAYADISAQSGYNALTRDPEFGYKFLREFQDKLLFGTDICVHGREIPNIAYFKNAYRNGRISKRAYEKIGWKNAERLLKRR